MRLHLEMWRKGRDAQYGSWPMSAETRRALMLDEGKELKITPQSMATYNIAGHDRELIARVISECGSAILFWSE